VLDQIVGTCLDKGAELDALAKLPEADRERLAEAAKRGETVTARVAEPATEDDDKAAALIWWDSLTREQQRYVLSKRRSEILRLLAEVNALPAAADPPLPGSGLCQPDAPAPPAPHHGRRRMPRHSMIVVEE
jgi:hypothetical protein